jgi:hypothetical protein
LVGGIPVTNGSSGEGKKKKEREKKKINKK